MKKKPKPLPIIQEGEQYVWDYITSVSEKGVILLPAAMYVRCTELPSCCGIKVLADFKFILEAGLNPKTHLPRFKDTGAPLPLLNEYGHQYVPYNEFNIMVAGVTAEEKVRLCEKLFAEIAQRVDRHHIHQFIIADRVNRSDDASAPLARYFAMWLKRNKYGTVIDGPLTVNGNYTNAKPTFVRTWTWIPPSKFTFTIKRGRIYGDMRKLLRLTIERHVKPKMSRIMDYRTNRTMNFQEAWKESGMNIQEWKKNFKVTYNLINRWK